MAHLKCLELLDICATDVFDSVVKQVEELMLPSVCLWALSIKKLNEPLIMHLIERVEFHLSNRHKNAKKVKK